MDGIINVYKEAGFTSHDVVAKLRGILHQKKIGHTGTLDPDAEGVLPVCLGKATKVCELLTGEDKTYQAVCKLGIVTDTQDTSGRILEEMPVAGVTEAKVRETVAGFVGEIQQIPPMYSALKVNGRKLYEYAREGKEIPRTPRTIQIHEIHIDHMNLEAKEFTMTVTCSKGTYIRTLCHDIGQVLGTGAVMAKLLRTRVSVFTVADALPLADIQALAEATPETLSAHILPVDKLFPAFPRYQVRGEGIKRLANGNPLEEAWLQQMEGQTLTERPTVVENAPQLVATQPVVCGIGKSATVKSLVQNQDILVYDATGDFKAIYRYGKGQYRVVKMF